MSTTEDAFWDFLSKLEGKWIGEITGKPGKGKGTRFYYKSVQDKFVRVINKAEFPPQEKNISGEIHEDEGYFSFDKINEKGILRVFYSEGYVTTYNLIEFDKGSNVMVFESIENENLPAGFLAKLTLEYEETRVLNEKFELAPKGNEYSICILNTWEKVC